MPDAVVSNTSLHCGDTGRGAALLLLHAWGHPSPASRVRARTRAAWSTASVCAIAPPIDSPHTAAQVGASTRSRRSSSVVFGSRLGVVDGAGHIPHLEQPEAFCRLLLEFLTAGRCRSPGRLWKIALDTALGPG